MERQSSEDELPPQALLAFNVVRALFEKITGCILSFWRDNSHPPCSTEPNCAEACRNHVKVEAVNHLPVHRCNTIRGVSDACSPNNTAAHICTLEDHKRTTAAAFYNSSINSNNTAARIYTLGDHRHTTPAASDGNDPAIFYSSERRSVGHFSSSGATSSSKQSANVSHAPFIPASHSSSTVPQPKVQAARLPALREAFVHPDPPVSKEHFPIRIGHYWSCQRILLVGEGDFSFANALAMAFGSAKNMVPTSLDSTEELLSHYGNTAASNLSNLRSRQARLLHGLDATCMAAHENLRQEAFDCIVFNNPHAGFGHGPEKDENVIQRHKDLVKQFFHNAARLLKGNGEIHVLHKITHPYWKWNLEEQANMNGLVLKECVPFDKRQYPGYENRRGAGRDWGESYNLGQCRTFKFTLWYRPLFERPAPPMPLLNTNRKIWRVRGKFQELEEDLESKGQISRIGGMTPNPPNWLA